MSITFFTHNKSWSVTLGAPSEVMIEEERQRTLYGNLGVQIFQKLRAQGLAVSSGDATLLHSFRDMIGRCGSLPEVEALLLDTLTVSTLEGREFRFTKSGSGVVWSYDMQGSSGRGRAPAEDGLKTPLGLHLAKMLNARGSAAVVELVQDSTVEDLCDYFEPPVDDAPLVYDAAEIANMLRPNYSIFSFGERIFDTRQTPMKMLTVTKHSPLGLEAIDAHGLLYTFPPSDLPYIIRAIPPGHVPIATNTSEVPMTMNYSAPPVPPAPQAAVAPAPTARKKKTLKAQATDVGAVAALGLAAGSVDKVGDRLDAAKAAFGDSMLMQAILADENGRELVKALMALSIYALAENAPDYVPKAEHVALACKLQLFLGTSRAGAKLTDKLLPHFNELAQIGSIPAIQQVGKHLGQGVKGFDAEEVEEAEEVGAAAR